MNTVLLHLSFLVLIWVGFPFSARGAGFTVTPMIQEVVLEEGEVSETYDVTVANEADVSENLGISVIDFGSLDESGGVAFLGATGTLDPKYALASWMQPETLAVSLAPGERRSIRVRIENSENLSPGGHYGAVVFKTVSATEPNIPSVAINQIFTSLVFVKKTGGAVYGLDLVSVEHASRVFAIGSTMTPRFKNAGNVHVVPRGEVRVTDPLGRLVSRGVMNEGSAIILPEKYREYPFKLFSTARAYVPGLYSFDFSYRYDSRDEKTVWSKQFFYFPPLSGFVALGIVGLIVFSIWYRRKRLGQ